MNRSQVDKNITPDEIDLRMTRVVLVDDHPFIRIGLRNILQKTPDIHVVGEAANGLQALVLAAELQPDVLLLDMEMPGLKGIDVAKKLKENGSKISILALSAYEDKHFILGMLTSGAAGYLTKEEAPDAVVRAIRGIANGERGWVSKRIAAQIAQWLRSEMPGEFSTDTQEKEMLRLYAAGKTDDEVSREMGLPIQEVVKQFSTLIQTIHEILLQL